MKTMPDDRRPSLLVSYVGLPGFLRHRGAGCYRSWVLDSGAYSAATSGKVIDVRRYADACAALLAGPDPPECVFALDVIGDPEATARNVEAMHAGDVPAVPTFHHGSPAHYLDDLARRYDRLALGGLVQRGAGGHGTRLQFGARLRFLESCFARIWPKWVHGFGCCDRRLLARIPFASADSTTWLYGLQRYGGSTLFGRKRVAPKRGQNRPAYERFLDLEVATYLGMERETAARFGAVMDAAGLPRFSLRFATDGAGVRALNEARVSLSTGTGR